MTETYTGHFNREEVEDPVRWDRVEREWLTGHLPGAFGGLWNVATKRFDQPMGIYFVTFKRREEKFDIGALDNLE